MTRIVTVTGGTKKQKAAKKVPGTTPKTAKEVKPVSQRGVDKAVAAAGSQAKLGALLGITQQAVYKWVIRGYVPLDRAIEIEYQIGIDRTELLDPRVLDALTPPTFD